MPFKQAIKMPSNQFLLNNIKYQIVKQYIGLNWYSYRLVKSVFFSKRLFTFVHKRPVFRSLILFPPFPCVFGPNPLAFL